MSSKLPLALLSLAAAAAAQGIVSPRTFTSAECNTYAYTGPGSTTTPDHVMQIHDDLSGSARTINSVAFRRDASLGSSYNSAGYTVITDVFMSNAAVNAGTAVATYDTNHGTNKVQVAAFNVAQWPAHIHTGASEPFAFKIPFNQPFAYNGVGSVCLDMRFTSKSNTSVLYFDYQSLASSTNPAAYDEARGTGCKATGITSPMTLSGSSTPNWPSNSLSLGWNGSSLPKNSLVYLCIGVSDKVWGAFPLPFLFPGTGGQPSGACTIYTDWTITVPTTTTATGTMSFNLGFQVNPNYNGASLYSQLATVDTVANTYGLIMSNLVQHQVIAPYTTFPVSIIYNSSGLPVSGTLNKNNGYPILFN